MTFARDREVFEKQDYAESKISPLIEHIAELESSIREIVKVNNDLRIRIMLAEQIITKTLESEDPIMHSAFCDIYELRRMCKEYANRFRMYYLEES